MPWGIGMATVYICEDYGTKRNLVFDQERGKLVEVAPEGGGYDIVKRLKEILLSNIMNDNDSITHCLCEIPYMDTITHVVW